MGKYFTIKELVHSNTAIKYKINNNPNEKQLSNLNNLISILDIIREHWGKPINVTSGFRCDELNKHPDIKGSKTSHHLTGCAADIKTYDNLGLLNLIIKLQKNGIIKFTELINEYPDKQGVPKWVHLAVDRSNLKNQIKTIK